MGQTLAVSQLKYPDIRRDLILYLDDVERVGVIDPMSDLSPQEDLGYLINFFLDDTEFESDPDGYIGLALVSLDESHIVREFVAAFRSYINEVSPRGPSITFKQNESWAKVKRAATAALNLLRFSG